MTQPATKLKIKQQILLMQNDFNKEERIMALVIGSIGIFVVYLILSGLIEYIKDEWTRINRGGQNQTEQRRRMGENYSHLCKIWNPLLEKWNQSPSRLENKFRKNPFTPWQSLRVLVHWRFTKGNVIATKAVTVAGNGVKTKHVFSSAKTVASLVDSFISMRIGMSSWVSPGKQRLTNLLCRIFPSICSTWYTTWLQFVNL